ncbi:uncharacterized protein [Nicotiana tomentosiformis]|uniref:uncharacterized protein n=1 Tax=Nicotiana tomentosiformis TaxID=4098 RepID=UPI00051B6A25|nr:neurofilament medium polypeptide-like [Nicotiana tomentosiformis]
MSDNQETQNVPSIVSIVSSSIKTPVIEPTLSVLTSPNPKLESQPPSTSSPTHSSSGSHRIRKISTPRKFVVVTSTSTSSKKMVDEDTVDREENQEISSLPVEEISAKEQDEAIENMLSITAEGSLIGGYEGVSEFQGEDNGTEVEGREPVPVKNLAPDSTTGELPEGPDSSAQKERYAPTWDETHCSSKEPRSDSEEVVRESEEDYDDMPIASLTRHRPMVSQESTPKRPTTRLQRKEALESALKNSQAKSRRRKLVKDGKVVNEKTVLVVNMDDEVEEEPCSLTRKRSQKHGLPKPKRGSSVSAESLNKSDDVVASENVVKESGDKLVEESAARVMEELGEKSVKSDEKGKNIRKSAKRKADIGEEPGSSKKAKVGDPRSAGKEKLRN